MEETQKMQENKMGVMPVPKLLISMSLPIMASMLIQALYNIVDSIFVARYSQDALTAVSLAFPIQSLMIALGTGTAVGVNALLSRSLGEKKFEMANKTAMNGLFLAVCSYIVIALFGVFGVRIFFESQIDNPAVVENGVQYMTVIATMSFGLFGAIILERLLQATGNTIYSMIGQMSGAITNLILDPIMIFGMFGFPEMGAAGAALATVIGQIVSMLVGLYFNLKKNKEIKFSLKGFRPDIKVIKTIYMVGIPSIIMQSIGSILTFCFNKILLMFSEVAVSVYGIYFKLNSFIFMPVFGLNNGLIPIIAYNYGAQKKKRIISTIKLSIGLACGIMVIGVLIFQLAPVQLLSLFDAEPEMVEIGVKALRIISLSFIFAGYGIVTSSVFQAFGNGVYSLITSVIRQLLVILPVAYIFAVNFGLDAVWWSYPIAELVAVVVSTVLFINLYNKKIKGIPD